MQSKKIFSTTVLIIFFVLVLISCLVIAYSLAGIKASSSDVSGDLDEARGEFTLLVAALMGVALLAPFFLAFVGSILTIAVSSICLIFSVRNARIDCKPVRIINIILSCFFAAAVALGIIAIILLRFL